MNTKLISENDLLTLSRKLEGRINKNLHDALDTVQYELLYNEMQRRGIFLLAVI